MIGMTTPYHYLRAAETCRNYAAIATQLKAERLTLAADLCERMARGELVELTAHEELRAHSRWQAERAERNVDACDAYKAERDQARQELAAAQARVRELEKLLNSV